MHLVVRIISVTTILILHKSEPAILIRSCDNLPIRMLNLQSAASRSRGWNVTTDKTAIAR